jgi:hypothetical protein
VRGISLRVGQAGLDGDLDVVNLWVADRVDRDGQVKPANLNFYRRTRIGLKGFDDLCSHFGRLDSEAMCFLRGRFEVLVVGPCGEELVVFIAMQQVLGFLALTTADGAKEPGDFALLIDPDQPEPVADVQRGDSSPGHRWPQSLTGPKSGCEGNEASDHFVVIDQVPRRTTSADVKVQAKVSEGAMREAQVHSGVV